MKVAPSILSADFSKLYEDIAPLKDYGAEYLHIDVMDGHFVPNISMGAVVYRSLKEKLDMVFDVHIMISNPLQYAETFIRAGADILTFHYEATEDPLKVIKHIQKLGAKAGISIKPNTKVEVLEPFLKHLDLVLIMSVEPGFGGQVFLPNALDKIEYLKNQKIKYNFQYEIEVDGGINIDTAKLCKNKGVDILVAGTYIFQAENRKKTIEELIKL